MREVSSERLKRRLELVRHHVDCENRHDLDGILATFGQAEAYEDRAWRRTHPGAAGVRAYYEELLGACADLHISIRREHVASDEIVLEVTITGTHTGRWHGLPATGRRFELPLCAIYSFDAEDRLAGERIYYDRATILAQLGVFREPEGPLGRAAMALNHPLTLARALLVRPGR